MLGPARRQGDGQGRNGSSCKASPRRYRSRQPYVDESLFGGGSSAASSPRLLQDDGSGASKAVGDSPVRRLNGDASLAPGRQRQRPQHRPSEAAAIVLTESELNAILHPHEAEAEAQHRAVAAAEQAFLLQNEAFKLGQERRRQEAAQLAAQTPEAIAEAAAVREHAALLLQEQRDEVKRMNQMVLYSRCAVERDVQLAEKAARAAEERRAALRLDAAIEAQRVAALRLQEERQAAETAERRRGASVISAQLVERQEARFAAAEALREEGEHMKADIARRQREDEEAASRRRDAAASLMAQVVAANAVLMDKKREARLKEAEADAAIAAYVAEREAREQAEVEVKEAAAAAREMQVLKLRAQQERVADTRSQIDELRAKRWRMAAEKEERAKEQAARDRKAAIQRDLTAAREAQHAIKVQRAAEAAAADREAAAGIAVENQRQEAALAAMEASRRAGQAAHQAGLQAQQAAKRVATEQARAECLAEGAAAWEALAQERETVERIRQAKLAALQAEGVPAKYRAQLVSSRLVNW